MGCYANYINGKIVLIEASTNTKTTYDLGENLFNFLSLDLSEYNKLREEVCHYAELSPSSFSKLKSAFPKTIKYLDSEFSYYRKPIFIGDLDGYLILLHSILAYNKEISQTVYEHPYVLYSDKTVFDIDPYTAKNIILYNSNLSEYQSIYNDIILKCFIENTELSPLQNYHSYILSNRNTPFFDLFTGISSGIRYIPYFQDPLSDNSSSLLVAMCSTLSEFLFYELFQLLSNNVIIKKCQNCGNYFILKGHYHTDYCDRIPKGETTTCKRIAAARARTEKINSNPIQKEYQKAYKRNFAKTKDGRWKQEQFRTWSEEATQKRDHLSSLYETAPSAEILQAFKDYLGNR